MSHTRRDFLRLGVSTATAAALSSYPAAMPRRQTDRNGYDSYTRLPTGSIRFNGILGQRIDCCIQNRIAAEDAKTLVTPFKKRSETWCWSSEFWGKWFLSAVDAWKYTQDAGLRNLIDTSLEQLVATQTPDGYIGAYSESNRLSNWDLWGRKYTLLGLLAHHSATGEEEPLQAARRLADHLLTEVGPGKADIIRIGLYRGMASSSILEPMVLLFNRTQDERYLDFARYIVSRWGSPGGPDLIGKALKGIDVADRFQSPDSWWSWENGQKAYEMMSCYEGLLELSRIDPQPQYLESVKRTVRNILSTEINIAGSGASMECWYHGRNRQTEPARHMMETCVTMTWIKLCDNLLRLTGEVYCADAIERAAYNALSGAMNSDGSVFSKYSPLRGVRESGELQCGTHLNCCSANGPRAMMLLPQSALMRTHNGVVVNLFEPCTAAFETASGNEIHLAMETSFPNENLVRMSISPDRPETFEVKIRIPGWTDDAKIRINGIETGWDKGGSYARVTREWRRGERLEFQFDMKPHAHFSPGKRHVHTAVTRGPIVFARDRRLGSSDIDETVMPVTDQDGVVDADVSVEADYPDVAMRANVHCLSKPGAGTKVVRMCDFASAGNTWSPESTFSVWMPRLLDPSNPAARG